MIMRPAIGMAVLILLVVGVGAGYLLRGSQTEAPATQLVKAEPLNGAATVSATLERTGDSATLHVHQLPAIAEDEVYEVWVQRAGVMEPRNTFVLDQDGSAEAAVPGPLDGRRGRVRHPRAARRQPPADHGPDPLGAALGLSLRDSAAAIVSARWRPATDTRRARPTSPARTAGGRSAPTA